jgi:hypothetical protein
VELKAKCKVLYMLKHASTSKDYKKVEHILFTSALDGYECSASHPGHSIPRDLAPGNIE